MAAVSNGMRVTYIDPRASLTACKANRYWQVRPNSDYALNLALIHESWHRKPTIRNLSPAFVSGMDALRERSRTPHRNGRRFIPVFPPPSFGPSSRKSPPNVPK